MSNYTEPFVDSQPDVSQTIEEPYVPAVDPLPDVPDEIVDPVMPFTNDDEPGATAASAPAKRASAKKKSEASEV